MSLIEIPAGEGSAEAWLSQPPDAPSGQPDAPSGRPGVLLLGDAFGLRPRLYEMADRIAGWGYVVLAPNVFYRHGRVEDVVARVDLTDPQQRAAFFATVRPRIDGLTPDRFVPAVDAYLTALRGLPGIAAGAVGVVGYCMGVRLAMYAAGRFPDVVGAVGGFHGGGLVTDAPTSPHLSLATARAEFVFGHADSDPSLPPEAVTTLGKALADAGLTATNEVYAGASHGFTMSDTAAWHADAAERHFGALHDLFSRRL
jgi:carboxymethylenebutenolidase